jgi:hypothetical protein
MATNVAGLRPPGAIRAGFRCSGSTTIEVAQRGVPGVAWQQIFALSDAIMIGATAWVRVTHPNPPDSEW